MNQEEDKLSTYNICIGVNAGKNLTTERFMFIITNDDGEIYRRQMDGFEEYQATILMLNAVVNLYPSFARAQGISLCEPIKSVTGDSSISIGTVNRYRPVAIYPFINN